MFRMERYSYQQLAEAGIRVLKSLGDFSVQFSMYKNKYYCNDDTNRLFDIAHSRFRSGS